MNQVSKANELGATNPVYLTLFYSCPSNECIVNIFSALPFDSWSLLSKYQYLILHNFGD